MDNQSLVGELARFNTLKQLYASEFFAVHKDELHAILYTPQISVSDYVKPRIHDFLRVAHWNIERGNNFDGVLHYLQTIPRLATADVVFLNELDVGMVRTGNRHVANDLAAVLGYHAIYFPEYIEITKGIGDELNLPGENTAALHGNAIFSRYPISNPRVMDLPVCFEHYEFQEKRYGRRIAIIADVDFNGSNVTVVATHLEVRNTPSCRARQMRAILDGLKEWNIRDPIVLAGDFNSNCFARGTRLRTVRGGWWLLRSDPEFIKHRLRHPDEGSEPLFDVLKQRGFDYKDFNTDDHTARVPIKMVEEIDRFPASIQRWIHNELADYNHELLMRLDWICGRGVRSLKDREIVDSISGIASEAPRTFRGLYYEDRRASDHAAIAADIVLGATMLNQRSK